MTETRHAKNKQCLYHCVLIALFITFAPLSLWAQNKSISGTVTDENNEPVAGASVSVKNTTTGTITDFNGKYTINAPDNATLVFSLLGYTSKEEKVNGRTTINVALAVDEQTLGEVVVEVGYGTQRKVTLAGAVSGVKGTEMRQTKNENPQNMLTGKIAGVRVWQKSAEPGVFNSTFDIRGYQSSGTGDPLVVIDGIPRSMSDFQRLNANDIDDISVLKDASAAIYGVFAANGVVLVTTKKGDTDGKVKFSYNGTYTFQKPSGMPVLADPFETMTLYNERAKSINNDGTVVTPIYGEDKFQAYRDGTLRSADWTSLMFSDYSPQTQHDVSISGGNNKVQYYVGLGYFAQEGFFKSGDLNYNKYNLRSNIGVEVIKGLKAEVNLSGYADQRNTPYSSAVDIIRNYWRQGVLFPAYADPEQTMLSYEGLDLEENSVAKMTADVSGYHKYEQKNFQSSAALTYDLGTAFSVLKGLSAKVMFSYDYRMDDNTDNRKEYYQYMYNKNTDSYDQKLYNVSHPNRLRRTFNSRQQVLSQFLLNYNRSFGDHKVNGFVGWEAKKQTGNGFYGQNDLAFASDYLLAGVDDNQLAGQGDLYDYAFEAVMGRANYSFADRYIIEGQFRYDGSSKLAPGHQWTFFPSASLAWRVSEEPFFKSIDALSFVNQLKLRASYGVMGNDNSSNYEWLSGYTYPATSGNAENGYYNQYVPGYIFDNQFIFGVGKQPLPNISYTWEMSKTFDVGADFEGWNGLFGFTVDYFDRRRSNIGARRTGALPTAVGSTAPLENLNSDRQFGLELELTHRNKIQDFSYKVKGIATITRRMFLTAVQNGPYGSSYLKWRGDNLNNRYQGVQFGYESAGRFQNWEDIWSYPQYTERDVLPGDYKYIDWNGDGEINGLDAHPYAFDQTPWLNFSLGLDAQYKNFDLNILFQGSALGSMEYTEPLYSIWGSNGGGTLVQYLDRWHPVDPTADLYNYTTEWIQGYYGYTGRYPRNDSQFNRVSTAYLRLKSVELGYTIPRINALKSMRLRVFANAYNLFTITGVKFVDPEHPDSDLGRLYPLNKTYTVGLSLSF